MTSNDTTAPIDLWYTHVEKATTPELLRLYREWMTSEELERGARFLFEPVREQFLVTRGLVRWVLSNYCDVEPHEWVFEAGPHGKPSVLRPDTQRPVFNISHTAGLIICGVSQAGPLGVDVECLERDKPFEELARRYFAPDEVDWFERTSPNERQQSFFRIWTLKEAYIKAVGKGLAIPLDSFQLVPPVAGQPSIRFSDVNEPTHHWSFGQLQLGNRFQLAIASGTGQSHLSVNMRETIPGRDSRDSGLVDFSHLDHGPVHRIE